MKYFTSPHIFDPSAIYLSGLNNNPTVADYRNRKEKENICGVRVQFVRKLLHEIRTAVYAVMGGLFMKDTAATKQSTMTCFVLAKHSHSV
jgi:hypothetical protein